jgi:hypothetical protein
MGATTSLVYALGAAIAWWVPRTGRVVAAPEARETPATA